MFNMRFLLYAHTSLGIIIQLYKVTISVVIHAYMSYCVLHACVSYCVLHACMSYCVLHACMSYCVLHACVSYCVFTCVYFCSVFADFRVIYYTCICVKGYRIIFTSLL